MDIRTISDVHIGKLDLNLLRVLEALFKYGNVSRAADALDVSQPSVSFSLRKLRVHFGDDLFVRVGGTMRPTVVGQRLRGPVDGIMHTVRTEIGRVPAFDPRLSERNFTICMSDIGELTFLPDIMAAMHDMAPNASIQSVAYEPEDLRRALVEGNVDLALGAFLNLRGDNFYQQTLFSQSFCCVLRKHHPTIRETISIKQFLSAGHAVVAQDVMSQELFERRLLELGFARRIVLRSPHFMSVPLMLSQSDLIATVPVAVGKIYSKLADLRVLPVPFEVPSVDLKQCWHRRAHGDPALVWFRKTLATLFVGRDPTSDEDSLFWSKFTIPMRRPNQADQP